jgi:hypothetical protein
MQGQSAFPCSAFARQHTDGFHIFPYLHGKTFTFLNV